MKFLNPGKGPLAISLLNGSATLFVPRVWQEIDNSLLSSPALLKALSKGQLIKEKVIVESVTIVNSTDSSGLVAEKNNLEISEDNIIEDTTQEVSKKKKKVKE